MDNVFLLKLIISFFIGGLWAITATVVADKFGSKVGGVISGLPSTGLFSLLFIAWTQNTQAAVIATTVIPIVVGVETFFVLVYIYLVKKNFWKALIFSLFIWFVLAFIVFFSGFNDFVVSLMVYLFALVICAILIEKVLKIKSVISRKKIIYTTKIILLRGLLSGFIISFIVFISKAIGPTIGGIFSGFPAMFLSTILITYFSQGAEFSAATMKSAVFSVTSLVLYSVMVRYTYVPLGTIWGTIISIVVSFTYAFFLYRLVISKLK